MNVLRYIMSRRRKKKIVHDEEGKHCYNASKQMLGELSSRTRTMSTVFTCSSNSEWRIPDPSRTKVRQKWKVTTSARFYCPGFAGEYQISSNRCRFGDKSILKPLLRLAPIRWKWEIVAHGYRVQCNWVNYEQAAAERIGRYCWSSGTGGNF